MSQVTIDLRRGFVARCSGQDSTTRIFTINGEDANTDPTEASLVADVQSAHHLRNLALWMLGQAERLQPTGLRVVQKETKT